MNGNPKAPRKPRRTSLSWGIWAERAVVRALEIEPSHHIRDGLLCGQSVAYVALAVARAVGYLTGTQRAPDLSASLRAWLDRVGMVEGNPRGARLGGLSWREWAERAAVTALEIEPEAKVETALLHGQFVWEVATTIARSIGVLTGARRASAVPAEIGAWLQQKASGLNDKRQDTVSPKEDSP